MGRRVGVGNTVGGLGIAVDVGVADIGSGVSVGAMVAIARLVGTGVGVDGLTGVTSTSSSPKKLGVGVGVGGMTVGDAGIGV